MSQPTPWDRSVSFTETLQNQEGLDLDREFDNGRLTTREIIANLELIQRDDGALQNDSVTPDTLDSAVLAMIDSDLTPIGEWAIATLYNVSDVVEVGATGSFVAVVQHISGASFAIDKAAGKWVTLSGVTAAELSSNANGFGASLIGIEDAGGYFTGTDVEGALQELGAVATIRKFDTIALLRAATARASHEAVSVLGYYAVGDGGGGEFYWDSASVLVHNGGTVLQPLAGGVGRWIRTYTGTEYCNWFGAHQAQSSSVNAAAIQAALDYRGANGGGRIKISFGIYEYDTKLLFGYDGAHIEADGDNYTGDGGIDPPNSVILKFTGTGDATLFGPGTASVDGDHWGGYNGLTRIAILGNNSSNVGIFADNCALHLDHCYSYGHGSYGIQVKRGWTSSLKNTVSQLNGDANWVIEDGCNAVVIEGCSGLSTPTEYGMVIRGGTRGVNNLILDAYDAEGCRIGLFLDTTVGPITGLVVSAPNFEANIEQAIYQTDTGNLIAPQFIAGQYYGSGNGIRLANVFAGEMHSPKLTDCDIDILTTADLLIYMPRLESGAEIHNGIVISNAQGSYPIGSFTLGSNNGTDRRPFSVRRSSTTWANLRETSDFSVTVTGAGAAVATFDAAKYNQFNYVFTNAATTGFTLTASAIATLQAGEDIVFRFENDVAASGTIVFPAAFKKTAAVVIPTTNKSTTVTFTMDGSGLLWEKSRATDAG